MRYNMKSTGLSRVKQGRDAEHIFQLSMEHLLSRIKSIFKVDPATRVSKFRFNLLKIFYLLIAAFLGIEVWTEIFTHTSLWQSLPGVAYSFWGAFTLLAILGLYNPLKMVPLLLIQFLYKIIWLIMVAYPLWSTNQLIGSSTEGMAALFVKSVVVDLLVIPWPYVFKTFILTSERQIK
jgi:hypothetical protein